MERLKILAEKLNMQLASNVSRLEILDTVLALTREICINDNPVPESNITEAPKEKTVNKEVSLPKKEKVSLNEGIKKGEKDISEKLSQSAVGSLHEVIGVNQRFIFTHVFFNGEIEYFQKVISILEKASSFEEANQLFRNILPPEVLTNNPDTTDQFIELLNRRFSTK
jgi:hypothetical protein